VTSIGTTWFVVLKRYLLHIFHFRVPLFTISSFSTPLQSKADPQLRDGISPASYVCWPLIQFTVLRILKKYIYIHIYIYIERERLYIHANLQDNRTYYYYYYYYALFVITPIENIHNYRALGYMVSQLFCSYNSWHKHFHFSYHHLLINTYAPHYVY